MDISDDYLNNKDDENKKIENTNNNKDNQDNKSNMDLELKPYTFNKKVILGIAIIISISALISIFVMNISQSAAINVSLNIFPLAEKSSSSSLSNVNAMNPVVADSPDFTKIDKKFILIQEDFGWNGTNLGPSIEVSKGDVVQIVIINAGTMAHNFGIAKISPYSTALLNKITALPSFERINHISYNDMSAQHCPGCKPMFHNAHINTFMEPLSQQVITFTATESGEFKYFCMVRGHLWLGMFGDFIVKEKVI